MSTAKKVVKAAVVRPSEPPPPPTLASQAGIDEALAKSALKSLINIFGAEVPSAALRRWVDQHLEPYSMAYWMAVGRQWEKELRDAG